MVNDGCEPYRYRCGQRVIERKPAAGEGHSLCMNLRAGLAAVRGVKIIIVKDDDYLAPAYVATMARWLAGAELAGSCPAIYYDVRGRVLRRMRNAGHASLGQTGFRRSLVPRLTELCGKGRPFVDIKLRRLCKTGRHLAANRGGDGRPLDVSMKCLPGEPGIGIGHRMRNGERDGDFAILRTLIGPVAARLYEEQYCGGRGGMAMPEEQKGRCRVDGQRPRWVSAPGGATAVGGFGFTCRRPRRCVGKQGRCGVQRVAGRRRRMMPTMPRPPRSMTAVAGSGTIVSFG